MKQFRFLLLSCVMLIITGYSNNVQAQLFSNNKQIEINKRTESITIESQKGDIDVDIYVVLEDSQGNQIRGHAAYATVLEGTSQTLTYLVQPNFGDFTVTETEILINTVWCSSPIKIDRSCSREYYSPCYLKCERINNYSFIIWDDLLVGESTKTEM